MEVANPLIKHSLVDTINAKRAMGVLDEQIAYMLNLTPSQVGAVPLPKPQPNRQRAIQHAQLMQMAQALMPRVEKGEVEATQLMLKVMQREANLLGLDAPKEQVVRNFNMDIDGLTVDELREVPTEEIKRRLLQLSSLPGEATADPTVSE